MRGIKLLHDNAPAHKSAAVQTYIKDNHIETLPVQEGVDADLSPDMPSEASCSSVSTLYQKARLEMHYRNWLDAFKSTQTKGEYLDGLEQGCFNEIRCFQNG